MSGNTMREQIAARRAAAQKTTPATRTVAARASANVAASRGYGRAPALAADEGELEDKTVSGQIKKAGRIGKLDLSSLNLNRIPPEAYTALLGIPADELSNPPQAGSAASSSSADVKGMTSSFSAQLDMAQTASKEDVFGKGKQKEEWTEPEAELVLLNVEGNAIVGIERELAAFGGLKTVNLASNRISSLPDSFADLLRLTSLNLSHNSFTSLPQAILLLSKLEVLDLSHNALTSLDFSSPVEPSDDGLAYGAGFLSTSFSRQAKKGPTQIWPVLRNLNLGHNRLSAEGLRSLHQAGLRSTRLLNLEDNALEGELDLAVIGIDAKAMPELASLILSGNGYLQGVKGEPATGCKVDTVGTGTSSGARPVYEPSAKAAATSNPDSRGQQAAGDHSSIPKSDMALVYRSCPAATFDSLPLDIDLDLYLPSNPPSDGSPGHPLVIWFHGGGLLQGNKENLPPHFRRLPQTPFESGESVAVISPNYRLAPQVPIIDILSDVTALLSFVREKLNDRIAKAAKGDKRIDTSRICLSGGSAGGYLALIAGMAIPSGSGRSAISDEDVGGYRGEKGIKCIAPFYPITDLADPFWATETNPVPWFNRSVPHAEAKPHIDPRAAPVCTAVSGGPRSILYMYMLQHALFPSLLFRNQRSVGSGLDSFRPSAEALSITSRLDLIGKGNDRGVSVPPIYFAYGGKDDKVQPMEKTLALLKSSKAEVTYEYRPEGDHQFDEPPSETCEEFREWLGRTLL